MGHLVYNYVYGTSGNDPLNWTAGPDYFDGVAGSDTMI